MESVVVTVRDAAHRRGPQDRRDDRRHADARPVGHRRDRSTRRSRSTRPRREQGPATMPRGSDGDPAATRGPHWKSDPQTTCMQDDAATTRAARRRRRTRRPGRAPTAPAARRSLGLLRSPLRVRGGVQGQPGPQLRQQAADRDDAADREGAAPAEGQEESTSSRCGSRVNGKRAKVFKRGGRWRARADLRRLKRGRYVVRITVTLKNGKKLTGVRRYRTCRDAIAGGPPRL